MPALGDGGRGPGDRAAGRRHGGHVLVRRGWGDGDDGGRRTGRAGARPRVPRRCRPSGTSPGGRRRRAPSTSRLYNPTAAPAVVDVSFLTTGRRRARAPGLPGHHRWPPGSWSSPRWRPTSRTRRTWPPWSRPRRGPSWPPSSTRWLVARRARASPCWPGRPGPATTWRFAQTTAVQGGNVTLVVANPGPVPGDRPRLGRACRGRR